MPSRHGSEPLSFLSYFEFNKILQCFETVTIQNVLECSISICPIRDW